MYSQFKGSERRNEPHCYLHTGLQSDRKYGKNISGSKLHQSPRKRLKVPQSSTNQGFSTRLYCRYPLARPVAVCKPSCIPAVGTCVNDCIRNFQTNKCERKSAIHPYFVLTLTLQSILQTMPSRAQFKLRLKSNLSSTRRENPLFRTEPPNRISG